jgi:hypothetical protein
MLALYEELFLLTLNEHKSGSVTLSKSETLPYGLVGAALIDLILQGRVQLDEKSKVVLKDATPTGDSFLDNLLEKVTASNEKPKKLAYWIENLGLRGHKQQKELIAHLAEEGILSIEEKRYLWVIPYAEYSERDASAKYFIKTHLREVVLAGEKPDQRATALLSLANACGLLIHIFTVDELKLATIRVEDLVKDEVVGQAVIEAIYNISSAIVAVIAATS